MTPSPFRPGAPLRASDLARVAGEASAAQMPAAGFLSFQNGSAIVPRNPRRNRPAKVAAVRVRPFACRIGRDTAEGAAEGAQALFCYLPPETAQAVRFRGAVVSPGQTLGTAQEPWVRLGAAADIDALYLVIEFETQPPEKEGCEARIVATGWTLSTDGTAETDRWPHLVWADEADIGAVQYHLGSLSLGDPSGAPSEEEDIPPDTPICGNPLNGTGSDGDDVNPLDVFIGSTASSGGGDDRHPLDYPGDGGYTPTCKDNPNEEL